MNRFNDIIEVVLRHEGGYINDKDDAGGETNFGISKRSFPDVDIRNLTKEAAKKIYFESFWRPIRLHLINDNLLALHVFDHAVNAGSNSAVTILQRVVGADQDGILGPKTAELVNNYPQCLEQYIEQRKLFYMQVSKMRNNSKFLKGWLNRVDSTKFV